MFIHTLFVLVDAIPKNEEDVENVENRFDDLTEREITSGPVALDWWLQGANFLWDIFFFNVKKVMLLYAFVVAMGDNMEKLGDVRL